MTCRRHPQKPTTWAKTVFVYEKKTVSSSGLAGDTLAAVRNQLPGPCTCPAASQPAPHHLPTSLPSAHNPRRSAPRACFSTATPPPRPPAGPCNHPHRQPQPARPCKNPTGHSRSSLLSCACLSTATPPPRPSCLALQPPHTGSHSPLGPATTPPPRPPAWPCKHPTGHSRSSPLSSHRKPEPAPCGISSMFMVNASRLRVHTPHA